MLNLLKSCPDILKILALTLVSSISFAVQQSKTDENVTNYTHRWQKFDSKLILTEKSFQKTPPLPSVIGSFELIEFESDGMSLKALINQAPARKQIKSPAIVYLHGGFALRTSELAVTNKMTEAGFIVMAPSYRGENDNPGSFELFMGEVRDAKSAIAWLANQPFVDQDRIYVFGWSVGGGIALNLSLHDDLPVNFSASSAGIYDLDLIKSWATEDDFIKFPYDYRNDQENHFRLPIYHLTDMVRTHTTYIGSDDDFNIHNDTYQHLYPDNGTLLTILKIPGDHVSSLEQAIDLFLEDIKAKTTQPTIHNTRVVIEH